MMAQTEPMSEEDVARQILTKFYNHSAGFQFSRATDVLKQKSVCNRASTSNGTEHVTWASLEKLPFSLTLAGGQ